LPRETGERHGILAVQTYGDNREYSIINEKEIVRLLIPYKHYVVIESFKDIEIDLNILANIFSRNIAEYLRLKLSGFRRKKED
jgi:hypothetical protein